jgi:cytidylate kinase
MEAIILSGMPAVGKTTVAGIVAKRLGLKFLGISDILKEMAGELGYKTAGEGWWDTEEAMRFCEERKRTPDFDKRADEMLVNKAKAGNVVITSYTAPWICEYGIKVWLSGSLEKRAQRMSERDKIPFDECIKIEKKREEENYNLYKHLYGIEFGKDMKPFELRINTDDISAEQVADVIIKYVKDKSKK